ncbi:MAG: hypothetical protein ACRYGP_21515 [Janthinobacterium lividum]
MPWEALTDRDNVDVGALIHIDRGYSDVPPQPDEEILIANRNTGHTVATTVVSASGDRLELSDGMQIITLKPSSAKRENILDADGKYYESWIVL